MPDYGMLNGLGQGLQIAFKTYMGERNRQESLRQQNLNNALLMDKQGKKIAPGTEDSLNPGLIDDPGNQDIANLNRNILIQQYKQMNPKATPEEIDTQIKPGLRPEAYEKAAGLIKPEFGYLSKLASIQAGGEKNQSGKSDKTLSNVRQMLESARGNPAAAQAERDIYAADKAKSLMNMYGDPNKLNPQMVGLLTSEIAKIAQGGAPTMTELEGLKPSTLASSLAGVWQKLSNKPTPANAAAFIKQYSDYAGRVKKDAQKVITDKYGRIINSSRKQLGEDNYNILKQEYLDRFANEPEESQFEPDVLQYAQQHGISPEQAQAIKLQRTGGK